MTAAVDTPLAPPAREVIYRHRLATRITHWINVLCFSLLLMSGLQIFNAHPRLYWGAKGADYDQPFVAMTAIYGPNREILGRTRIGPLTLATTGVLGASTLDGRTVVRGFPAWATVPSYQDLGAGRRWHFFFAWLLVINGAVYLLHAVLSGHFRKDLLPTGAEIKPRHIWRDIVDHVRLKHPTGEAAKRYNVLQKLAYLSVLVLLPLIVLTGLTMSPGMNAAVPWLVDIFGGRQSARTIHFICAFLMVLFIVVHVIEVFLAGVWNEVRSMITGWYEVRPEASDDRH